MDLGLSSYFTNDLTSIVDWLATNTPIGFGKGTTNAKAYSSIKLEVTSNGIERTVTFIGVYYILGLRANLLSIEKLRNKGLFYRNDR